MRESERGKATRTALKAGRGVRRQHERGEFWSSECGGRDRHAGVLGRGEEHGGGEGGSGRRTGRCPCGYLTGVGGSSASLAAGAWLAWFFGVLSGELTLFGEVLSASRTTALALAFSFSRSVWLTGAGVLRPAATLEGSFSLEGASPTCLVLSRLGSMLLLTGRGPPRPPVTLMELDLAGRGRLRYWMVARAPGAKNPGSTLLDTSRLVLRPLAGFTGMPEDFWTLLSVAEPPVCMTVAVPVAGGFL